MREKTEKAEPNSADKAVPVMISRAGIDAEDPVGDVADVGRAEEGGRELQQVHHQGGLHAAFEPRFRAIHGNRVRELE